MKETHWNCGLKEWPTFSHRLLKKGFWVYRFISLCTRRRTSLLSPPPPFFLFPCVYVRMKGHSYKLTRRLKHKETLYNGEVKKENQNRCRNGLQSVRHILFFCYGFVRRIAMLFFFFFTSPFTHHQKKQTDKKPQLDHIVIFLVWAFVFVLSSSTVCKGKFCRTFTKIQPETAIKMGISSLPTVSFEGIKTCKDMVHWWLFMWNVFTNLVFF